MSYGIPLKRVVKATRCAFHNLDRPPHMDTFSTPQVCLSEEIFEKAGVSIDPPNITNLYKRKEILR